MALIEAANTALDKADMILGVFDNFQFACVFLMALAYTLRIIWIGIHMSTTGKSDLLHEFTHRGWKIWLAMTLSYMSLAPSYSNPPEWLKQDVNSSPFSPASIVIEAKKILLVEISERFQMTKNPAAMVSTKEFESAIAKFEERVLIDEDLRKELYGSVDKFNWADGYEAEARSARLVGLISGHYNIDSLMRAGLGMFISAGILNTALSIAGVALDFQVFGTGNSNHHVAVLNVALPLLAFFVATGLLCIGFALAVIINFFVIDLQFLILAHLSPVFLLLFAFESTKRYADALVNSFAKNLLASLMVYFCFALAINVWQSGDLIRMLFGMALVFALPRYSQQLVADLVGGFATPSEDLLSYGRSAQSFNAIGQGLPGGLESYARVAREQNPKYPRAQWMLPGAGGGGQAAPPNQSSTGLIDSAVSRPINADSNLLPLPVGSEARPMATVNDNASLNSPAQ